MSPWSTLRKRIFFFSVPTIVVRAHSILARKNIVAVVWATTRCYFTNKKKKKSRGITSGMLGNIFFSRKLLMLHYNAQHQSSKSSWLQFCNNNQNWARMSPLKIPTEKPKRFYKKVGILQSNGDYEISLDHRKLKTPNAGLFKVSSEPLALAIAAEWDAQHDVIQRSTMHLVCMIYPYQHSIIILTTSVSCRRCSKF